MNIAVIGGTRYIGLRVVRALVRAGHKVTVINRGRTPGTLPAGVQRKCADMRNREELLATLRSTRAEVLVDLVLESPHIEWMGRDLAGTIPHWIHCSSVGVYVPMRLVPARETDPTGHVEGLTFLEKLRQEELLLQAQKEGCFEVTLVRATNVMGTGDVPLDIWGARRIGFFRRVSRGLPITIPNDGRALFQPVYVEDLARLFVAAAELPVARGQIYNCGGDQALTLTAYAELLKELLGSNSALEYRPVEELIREYAGQRTIEPAGARFLCEHAVVDSSKAEGELGFRHTLLTPELVNNNLQYLIEHGLLQATIKKAASGS